MTAENADSPPRKAPDSAGSGCFSRGTIAQRAAELDAADPLASHRAKFVMPDDVVAYLDGNSLGRPLHATRDRLAAFVDDMWGRRLIRAWDEGWMDAPTDLGDTIARVTLGAAAGQTVVADSTTVLLYKLVRAAVDDRTAAEPRRTEILLDTDNFPTDRFVVEGVAAERGLQLVWIRPDPAAGVTPDQVRAAVSDRTALVLLSHVAYRSGHLADLPAITAIAHEAGALVLWDLCHSAGSVEISLDEHEVDLAVGCTYKYLNGGPGAPAFAYLANRHHGLLQQPIQGWMGVADVFAMGERYQPAGDVRQLISGTPPIVGMLPMRDMLALIDQVGMPAVRRKSVALTGFAIEVADALLTTHDVRLVTPRDPQARGSHITLDHPEFRRVTAELWQRGVIPDFRPPQSLRVGLSPLSTSFTEVAAGLSVVAELLSPSRS